MEFKTLKLAVQFMLRDVNRGTKAFKDKGYKYTQRGFVREFGYTQAQISLWVSGKGSEPTSRLLQKLIKDCGFNYLTIHQDKFVLG